MSWRRVRAGGCARRRGRRLQHLPAGRAAPRRAGPGRDGGGDGAGALLVAGLAAALLPPARRGYVGRRGPRARCRRLSGKARGGERAALPPLPPPFPPHDPSGFTGRPGPPGAWKKLGLVPPGFSPAAFSLPSRAAGSVAVMSVDVGSESMKIAIVKPGVPMEIVLNK